METGLVVSNRNGAPTTHEMTVFETMSHFAVNSKMYKGIGEQAGVMMIMLAARELGIPPMSALNGGLNIINGKVEISARMMNALIRKAGHRIETKESTDKQCILTGIRGDTGEALTASFTLAEAQQAGLVKVGGGWTKWPSDMCYARALSRLARRLFSDVIGIGYVEGEISQQTPVKPEECQVAEVIQEPEITLEQELEETDKFIALFDQPDKSYALEYLKVVMKHFSWTSINAINELMKDKDKLHEKFNAWKKKNNKGEDV